MKENVLMFIKQTKSNIRKGNTRINELHRQIEEYEGIIDVISLTGGKDIVNSYYKKLNKCYSDLEDELNAVHVYKRILNSLNYNNNQRGERCA